MIWGIVFGAFFLGILYLVAALFMLIWNALGLNWAILYGLIVLMVLFFISRNSDPYRNIP